ncbi:MAG: hypothetical protein IPG35_18480 [Flavobacteriales bacterium]|nr:hypothetical protein [Flavobacteriales bacterium]
MVTGLSNGTFTSLAVVAGFPCIAYYKFEDRRVAFRRTTDANGGDTWGAEASIHYVNGQLMAPTHASSKWTAAFPPWRISRSPAPTYLYVAPAKRHRHQWLNPVAVDAGGHLGRDITMHLVDGRPAIAY